MVSIRLFEIVVYQNTIVNNKRRGHVELLNIHLRKTFYLCKATKEIFLPILVPIILSQVLIWVYHQYLYGYNSQVITRHVLCRKLCTCRKKVQIILRKTAQEKQLLVYLFNNYITNCLLNLQNYNRGKLRVD